MGERARVEYLILADAVEVADGRLDMRGGGWDTLLAPEVPRTA